MPDRHVTTLTDCTEYRQTLLAQPPRLLHATALLLVMLAAAAIAWSALTEAMLVVRARGRVRPMDEVTHVFTSSSSEIDGRVAEVHFQEGTPVEKGQVLLRLDTQHIDNRIAELQSKITAAGQELAEVNRQEELLQLQQQAALSKVNVELAEAQETLHRAQTERESKIRHAQAELTTAEDRFARLTTLASKGVVSQQELIEARSDLLKAREELQQAQLPADDGQVNVLHRTLEAVRHDYAVRAAELQHLKVVKHGEANTAGKQLANLQLARERSVLRAPVDGVVVSGRIKRGDVLEAGKSAVEIAPGTEFQFEASVLNEEIGDLQVGMPVRIKFDALDYQQYGALDGQVYYISPDSQTQSDSKEPKSVTYLVRIKPYSKTIGRGDLRGAPKLGMAGTAEIVVKRKSLFTLFFQTIRRSISIE